MVKTRNKPMYRLRICRLRSQSRRTRGARRLTPRPPRLPYLLVDNQSCRTTSQIGWQVVALKDLFTVGENDLLAEPDRFAPAAGIDVSRDIHADLQGVPAVAEPGKLADIAVLDNPRHRFTVVTLHIEINSDMRIAPQQLAHSALQRDLSFRIVGGPPAVVRKDCRAANRQDHEQDQRAFHTFSFSL